MPIKPIDRLLFAQGGDCFFCKQPLDRSDASVEHLVAQAHGGKDNVENLVVCCQRLNSLFGHMPLKEKLEILLRQRGAFKCPAQALASSMPAEAPDHVSNSPSPVCTIKPGTPLAAVVGDLQKRGNSRPATLEKLANTIKTVLEQQKLDASEADKVLHQLRCQQFIAVADNQVSYQLPNVTD